jgi:hypothetical protein
MPKDRKRDRRRLVLAAMLMGLPAAASRAWAQTDRAVTVVLLRPSPAQDLVSEAIVRIKSELSAGGFQVAVTDVPATRLAAEPSFLKEWAARVKRPSATLAVFGELGQAKAELWVVDRITGDSAVRTVEVQTSADRPISEVLAIRAQEILRAMLVEVQVEESRPAPPAPPRVVSAKATPEHNPVVPILPWRFGVELGASAFGGSGGLGTSAAPVARLRLALDERFWVRLSAIGLGTRPPTRAASGSATVSQSFVLLECSAWFRRGRALRPTVSLGIGAERFAVDGSAKLPYRGEQNASWFFAADAGVGLSLRLGRHWEIQLETHALVAAPRPWVQLYETVGARAGQPTLLAVLSLAGGA